MPAKRSAPWQDDSNTWYRLERWRKRRRAQLRAEPLCAICLQRGVVSAATVADHVEPHRGDWAKFLFGKLQSLCETCHNRDKRYQDIHGVSRSVPGPDGWPISLK